MTDAPHPWDGVPLQPEKQRFHLLRHRSSGDKKVGEWWPPGEDKAGPFKAMWFGLRWGMPEHVSAEYEYLGPLYTQAEAAAIRAEERRKGMEEAARIVAAAGLNGQAYAAVILSAMAGAPKDYDPRENAPHDGAAGAAIRAAMFRGFAALPAPEDWRKVLFIAPFEKPTIEDAERAYRAMARGAHPDHPGGSHDAMARLNRAIEAARKELGNA
jgi:hypothetical protein